jgi:hypothetical protein
MFCHGYGKTPSGKKTNTVTATIHSELPSRHMEPANPFAMSTSRLSGILPALQWSFVTNITVPLFFGVDLCRRGLAVLGLAVGLLPLANLAASVCPACLQHSHWSACVPWGSVTTTHPICCVTASAESNHRRVGKQCPLSRGHHLRQRTRSYLSQAFANRFGFCILQPASSERMPAVTVLVFFRWAFVYP